MDKKYNNFFMNVRLNKQDKVSSKVDDCFLMVIFLSFVLKQKKETKKNSRQTRWLRPFCLANASLCVTDLLNCWIAF